MKTKTYKFLPLLVLYFAVIVLFTKDRLYGDEIRYLEYAENIVKGYYTTKENPNIANGPAYPLYLALFVRLKLPLIVPKLINGIWVFLAIILFYSSILLYASEKIATISAYFLGLHLPLLEWIPFNNTEAISIFLICALIYLVGILFKKDNGNTKNIILSGFVLGLLALTKMIFGYVIIFSLVFTVTLYLISRKNIFLKFAYIYTIGFIIMVPFFIHNYNLTGRYFYFGTNGGQQLYWMSSNYTWERGSWLGPGEVLEKQIPEMHPSHYEFYSKVTKLPWVEQNDRFLEKAKENIRSNPIDYLKNILSNTTRLLFDYPYSFRTQTILVYKYIPWNTVLLMLFLISLYPAWLHRSFIPLEIYILMGFILVYIGGSMLLASVIRYFVPAVPFFLLWVSFVFQKFIRISIGFQDHV